MSSNDEHVRTAIADQASDWFVANGEAPLDAREAEALAAWFQASPVNIEEFIGVARVASDLKAVRDDPRFSLEAILARARADNGAVVEPLSSRGSDRARRRPLRRWLPATAAVAACALLSVGVLLRWSPGTPERPVEADSTPALHFETRHGEQLTQRLADNSVLHLNTGSAVSIRYSKTERVVVLAAGQAAFEVAHEADRPFRVQAGSALITDLGTRFDVRQDGTATVVTVIEGRVRVAPKIPGQSLQSSPVDLDADQQVRLGDGAWPATPITVDAKRTSAWMQHQLVFDNEPLGRVAAEYSRYTSKPIEIATPTLKNLRISGVFATDDTDAFVAFLRSLKGVRVEVTDTSIRVSRP